jgi:hypothetical protein
MSAVELCLSPSDLAREMGAMRVWLDQHRFEPSSFSCRDFDDAVLVLLEFKVAHQARAFAERFGGWANGPPSASATPQLPLSAAETELGFVSLPHSGN